MRLLCLVILSVVILPHSLSAAPPEGEQFTYKTVDGRDLSIYVTRPVDWQDTDQRPAILFFHGGGWTGGAPGQFTEHAKYFASRGMVCCQAQYRLLDKKNSDPPAICIQDARSAIRWVRREAVLLGIDPDRIAAAGGSAGGHLAATLGTIDGHDEPGEDASLPWRANAMILFNPVFDNGPDGWGTKRVGSRYPEFSPAHNITKDTPPAIVFLGDSDSLVPVKTLEAFQAKMQHAGVRCETMIFPGMPHGFFNHGKYKNVPYVKTVRAADQFLAELGWLTGPPTLPEAAPAADDSPAAKTSRKTP
ncbi:MAG: alpha/beta hydrolase fold domain-containing protein [Fuerstiella sp.]